MRGKFENSEILGEIIFRKLKGVFPQFQTDDRKNVIKNTTG